MESFGMHTTALLPRVVSSRSLGDDRLLGQLRSALRESGYAALERVGCRVHEGDVVLSGRLSSYYLKQVAQETVLRTVRVGRVHNQIHVD